MRTKKKIKIKIHHCCVCDDDHKHDNKSEEQVKQNSHGFVASARDDWQSPCLREIFVFHLWETFYLK